MTENYILATFTDRPFFRNSAAVRSRESFTLIELLVVIGIIAILAGMLLPSLNAARAKARQLNCVSNMKNIGVSATMYIDENDGWALCSQPDGIGNWMNYGLWCSRIRLCSVVV